LAARMKVRGYKYESRQNNFKNIHILNCVLVKLISDVSSHLD
jgi:hypothetical protein